MITKEILKQLPYQGIKSKKIVSNETGNIILISISKGDELKKHISNTDASVLVLEGEILFKIKEQNHLLCSMDIVQFKKNEIHAVEAISDSKLILIK